MPSAYGPIFVRCRTNIYYCPAHTARFLSDVGLIYNIYLCPAQNIDVNILVFVGTAQNTQSNYHRQKSDPIYYRSYCAVTKADMDPLFDHRPVMFYLTGFGAHNMIFIANSRIKGLTYIRPKVARVGVGCLGSTPRFSMIFSCHVNKIGMHKISPRQSPSEFNQFEYV